MTETCPACGTPLPDNDGPDAPLTINGETYEMDKLSFAERKIIKRVLRELVLRDNPSADPDTDFSEDDLRLAFAIVCARKTLPNYSIEDGLELTPDDLIPAATGNVAGDGPPTKPAGKPRPRAAA